MEMEQQQKPVPPPVAPKPARTPTSSKAFMAVSAELQNVNAVPQKDRIVGVTESEKELEELTNKLLSSMNMATSEPDFVGLCGQCNGVIKGTQDACTALDKYYHSLCFSCQDCSRQLSGHSFYAVESRILCEGCYVNSLEKCFKCKLPITERILRATGKAFHPECFTCTQCKKSLDGVPFTVDAYNQIHCIEDFHMKYAPRCSVCREAILPEADGVETVRIVALDRNFHVRCYKCEDCGLLLSTDPQANACFPLAGRLLCRRCNSIRSQPSMASPPPVTAVSDL